MNHPLRSARFGPLALLLLCTSPGAAPLNLEEVVGLSLGELLEVKITTVSREEQPLMRSAAAVTVISAEEIRRSGASDLPDLLRGVPGAHIARVDGNTWAVGIRGFNGVFSNRLHVLVDGRSIYNPLFGGVNWDTLNLPLDNIERIEVVRGPGATLWGANAANGVINIITRPAADTQGTLAQLELRSPRGADLTLRHGGQLTGGGHWRLHGRLFDGGGFVEYPDRARPREERDGHLGARLDQRLANGDTLRLEGEFQWGGHDQYQRFSDPNRIGAFVIDDRDEFERFHLLANWGREVGADERWSLQAYLQHDARDQAPGDFRIDTLDLDFQHHLRPHPAHRLSWGLGYRRVEDSVEGSFIISLDPNRADSDLYSAFIQDEITLNETLRLIVGSKFEHNDRTGFEYQPSLRLAWNPSEATTVWGAATRAVRTPSRTHTQVVAHPFVVPLFPPLRLEPLTILGDPNPKSDLSHSLEVGLRHSFSERFSIDLALYHNEHERLLTFLPDANDPLLLIGATSLSGSDYGLELGAGWRISDRWRLNLSYARHHSDIDPQPAGTMAEAWRFSNAPANLFNLRSYLELTPNLELDAALHYVDQFNSESNAENILTANPVAAHWRADLRLGWRVSDALELSLTAQNLLDNSHPEYDTTQAIISDVPRSLFARATWRF